MRKPLHQYLPDYRFLLLIAGSLVLLDQVSKVWVRTSLAFTDLWAPFDWMIPYVRIVHWKNTGAAFGIFQNGSLIFTILGIIVTLTIINFFPLIPRSDRWLRAALAFELAGAFGNLLDRLTQGHVTDFISVLRFPVFNVADACISIGVVLILLPLLPHLFAEMEQSALLRRSRDINGRHSARDHRRPVQDEPVPLGLVGVLLEENEAVQRYSLKQEVLRIRQRVQTRTRGTSRG